MSTMNSLSLRQRGEGRGEGLTTDPEGPPPVLPPLRRERGAV